MFTICPKCGGNNIRETTNMFGSKFLQCDDCFYGEVINIAETEEIYHNNMIKSRQMKNYMSPNVQLAKVQILKKFL